MISPTLGSWLPPARWLCDQWGSYYSPSSNFLYTVNGSQYDVYRFKCRPTQPIHPVSTFTKNRHDMVTLLPPDTTPADVSDEPLCQTTPLTLHTIVTTPLDPPPPSSWAAYLQSLPHWDHELVKAAHLLDLPGLLLTIETDDALFLSSDGGAVDSKGSFGALLAASTEILA